jgi:epsilon-lactone hydrolase
MTPMIRIVLSTAILFALASLGALAPEANAQGRDVPARTLPVPDTPSPQVQKLIAAPLRNGWNVLPKTGEEWLPIVEVGAKATIANLPALRERMKVSVEKTTIDGVRAFIVTPAELAPANRNRVLLHMHGGCYVLSPGEAALPEAVMMAGMGGYKVVSVDYRMPPEAYFPAALDDGVTVYKNLLKSNGAKSIAIFGTSAGGR